MGKLGRLLLGGAIVLSVFATLCAIAMALGFGWELGVKIFEVTNR